MKKIYLVALYFLMLCATVQAQDIRFIRVPQPVEFRPAIQSLKISQLGAITSLTNDDLLVVVNDPGGTPATNKITYANFKTSIFASPTIVTPTIASFTNAQHDHSDAANGGLIASSGATTALDNLASVAINTALVLGTSDGAALGSSTKMWSDLFLASGAVVNFNNGNMTLTHAAGALTIAGGTISNPGAGGSSERFGAGATAAGLQATALGQGATAGAQDSICIGQSCTTNGANGLSSVNIGKSSGTNASDTVAIGKTAVTLAAGGVAIGSGANISAGANSIVLGQGATTGNANTFVAGSSSGAISNVFFGKGETNSTATAFTLNGTGGSGSNNAGADLKLAGGKGTGTGLGGAIIFQVAPAGSTGSSANALAEAAQISPLGVLTFPSTITAGGTTGDQTINKVSGTVNIAAAGTTVTVTNSKVTTSSIVMAVIRTNDATAQIKSVVPGSGSFVINITAATAEVSIGFVVLN
jgi:trimeric autotransporter adhesin